ncbi:MAG: hypothetical protein AB1632_04715 [Nitrospirota bacterium]
MGTILTLTFYLFICLFISRFIGFMLLLRKASGLSHTAIPGVPGTATAVLFDIFFLLRLFRTNKWLWAGSWLFHISFMIVILKHLRYFIEPVPGWIFCVQPVGRYAGFVLTFSLVYILILRFVNTKIRYVSYRNLFLTAVLLLMSITGLLMNTVLRQDLITIKNFMIAAFSLSPEKAPESAIFIIHFSLFLLLLPYLPSHILTAPFVIMDARKREDSLKTVMHEK